MIDSLLKSARDGEDVRVFDLHDLLWAWTLTT